MPKSKSRNLMDVFPEETREAANLLKQAVPNMVRHDIPPNPIHYALWYSYAQGNNAELKQRLDRIVNNFAVFPPEAAIKLYREYIINGELEQARSGQQQVIDVVDTLESEVTRSLDGGKNYEKSLKHGLEVLHEPVMDELPSVLEELLDSTYAMQEQQEKFLYRLQAAQAEVQYLRNQLKKTQMAASLDALTQVFNRFSFNRFLEQALAEQHPNAALIMLDLDHFKAFNDQYGHVLGDRVLQTVAQMLREQTPSHALCARYGGEEFAVILNPCGKLDEARALAEALRAKLQSLRVKVRNTDKTLDNITASFGVALAQPGDTLDSLIHRADEDLYRAKRSGRNSVGAKTDNLTKTRSK
ncbi:GGDEF domain-containing protein [Atopomonas sediminilitoris]|uniref:GGDEF domain-containing protein n=1 Tax=Atopomonas sediminilitoris TaxID=2919919 RepID=UPI001F4D8E44|nr:GGDEF domain-containing protein [Atopomonas sediminilitoris]MCJ8168577.1 GGDEF domain-containing protein [Atopomonas sediminilitoris]